MNQLLFELLPQCTLRLNVFGKKGQGTGFFVAPRLIVTCAHVVKDTDVKQINICWQERNYTAFIKALSQDSRFDLALLELYEPVSDHPCVYLGESVEPGDKLYSYGYTDDYSNGEPATFECEGSSTDPPLIKFKSGQVRPGMSGAPLLNLRTGKICGLVRLSRDRLLDMGGRAIPTTVILSQFRELVELQHNFHQKDEYWLKLLPKAARESLRLHPYSNLPSQTYQEFIGRKKELSRLLKQISLNYRAPIITVDGIGGVGKTALVLEAAYLCWEAKHSQSSTETPLFDAIIFTSAKESWLFPTGIVQRLRKQGTLRDIYREIAHTLDDPSITQSPLEDQLHRVYESLSRQRTLLIVDNLETIEDKNEVIAFLSELPPTAKAVITTREQIVMYASMRLDCLPKEDSLQLIQQQAIDKEITLSEEDAGKIYERIGGVPIALIYVIGQLASGYFLDAILNLSAPLPDDIVRFCFDGSVKPLQGKASHKLLMSLAMFRNAPVYDAVAEVAGFKSDLIAVNIGLARLQQLSLVRHYKERYVMLSLTREYALTELSAHPDFEQEGRERWVKWYLNFAYKYGGEDSGDWQIKYDYLESEWDNLLAVLYWCAHQDRYEDVKKLWKLVNRYTNIYGFWSERIFWLDWLIQLSNRLGDWSTWFYAMSRKGWTLTLMGHQQNLEAAEPIFNEAWSKREYADLRVQDYLAKSFAALRIRQGLYEDARNWLNIKEDLLKNACLEEQEHIRYLSTIAFYRADIEYLEGNYDLAKTLYQQVKKQAEKIGWQRRASYAQNRLADIAIKQVELHEAEKLLNMGLPVAERNKDKRLTADYQRCFANLEKVKGNLEKSREWAKKAMDGFNRLGMTQQAAEMRSMFD
ncbi:MAG TPA: trypsin-like peptidase domain-containing protein [Nostoc sp.]|uniref:trypsin-like peptidase domain-containing protein n=1 Tax=Nostoc sp. TaxID=1180 RepID=UPI002D468D9F|nr:trypsin-like peptidase domain-containing protein [Nostoc sp.]HYX16797.1 trypsin-like peptidase domain-containing protein [Nostoc sp.]